MLRTTLASIAGLALALAAAPAAAELYKWVDADGNIHFTDSPPRGKDAVDLSADADEPAAEPPSAGSGASEAIAYRGKEPSRLAFLAQVLVQFEDVPPGRRKDVGERRQGSSCSHPETIWVSSGVELKREASLRWHFHDLLRELGYRSPREIKTAFDAEQETGSDLSIIAIITELEVEECTAHSGGSRYSRPSDGTTRVKNASRITVEWQVRDNLLRRVVYEGETAGSFRDRYFVERTDELPGTFERAFLAASQELLADPEFVALLEPARPQGFANAGFERDGGRIAVAVRDGRCDGRGASFGERYEALEQSTATIRTASGHGSGFLVSGRHVVTNQHVVGSSGEVVVVLEEEEYPGRVVADDPVRDVALIELATTPPGRPLSVCRGRAHVGDTVYVIGTPLDEKLSATVTKGIVSQHRTLRDQLYYQTDAGINKGNSGGPAFNEQGEVIGIAVAAAFAPGGGGMGIGFLIPIDEALDAVIEASAPASRSGR